MLHAHPDSPNPNNYFASYFVHRYVDEAKTKKCILPCTPLAVVKIMEHVGVYDENLPVGDRLQGESRKPCVSSLLALILFVYVCVSI